MELETLLANKINALPPHLQIQLLDFVEFLLYKHTKETEKANTPETSGEAFALTEKGKSFLAGRLAEISGEPVAGSSWEDVKKRLYKKHGFENGKV